ncbi:MAG: PVC-type heme-binding CxxCH protein [Pirellulales bacterium]
MADSFSGDPESYSVSMWFRNDLPTGSRPVTAYLFSRGPDGDAQAPGDHLGIGGSYRPTLVGRLMVFNGNRADQVVHGRTQLEPGTWHHVVMVRDRKHVRVWLDGNTQPEIDADLDWTAEGSRSLFVGARCDQFAPLQGAAAQVAVYDRALQAAEITALHSKAAAEFHATEDKSQTTNESNEKPDPNRPASDPLSPQESLERIHVPRGFRVELVACEPNVIDPVAFDWDAAGRLWVVEMADYPLGLDGKGKSGGRVRVLEDRDHDGTFESSKLFAEGLNFPNGILTWRDGVIVTAAPQILFLSDTDGDGVADKQNVLLDGFMEGNQQLRLNGLRWGLNGWIVCASGGHHANYGTATKIRSHVNGKSYELGSRDFRFSPDTGEVAAETGPSQFGRNRDRWGHWFGTQNANPLWQYLIDDRYLARNPHVPIAKPIHYVLPSGSPPVYPASAAEKRYHNFQQAGHFTSACSGMIYNDDLLFGRSDAQHAFTCEPFHNLVQHNLLIDEGVSYRSLRPVSEGPFDFFASEDRWCRPVMARTGPDGALWIADMYRYMIEHPDWLPPEGKSELLPHYRLGDDKGRIYRIVPAGSSLKLPEPIAEKNSHELVAELRSSNDWRRDKAQQLLLERSETGAVTELRSLLASAPLAESRLQALATLAAMKQATAEDVEAGLRDRHPRVREFAVRAAEQLHTPAALDLLTTMANEPDAKVVLQLTLSLGEWPDAAAGRALSELACSHTDDPTIVAAVLTSALPHAQALASRLLAAEPSAADVYRDPLVRMALARRDYDQLAWQVSGVLIADEAGKSAGRLSSLLSVLQRLSIDLPALAQETQNVELKSAVMRLNKRLDQAAEDMQNLDAVPAERITAAALVSRVPLRRAQAVESLAQWLAPQFDVALQQQALTAMRESGEDSTPQHLASRWSELTPAVQASVIDVWMSRKGWVHDLLERLESGKMSAAGLDLNQRARLQQVPDKQIAERAAKFFNRDPLQSRKEVLERFRPALQGKGDTQRGLAVYRRACASCHRRGEEGFEVGPNLATVASHAPEKMLTNILAPNVDIQPGFQAYACLLTTGEVISGLLAGETAGSITIKLAGGQSRTIARSEIETLRNTNVSLMPEGLENTLSVQDVEDLIAALRAQ